LARVTVVNLDAGRLYDEIGKIMLAAGLPPIGMMVEPAMANTAEPSGRPAVDFRKEVLGQLAPPLTLMNWIGKPYADPKASRNMLAMGVRDGAVLDGALGRIHDKFIAAGNKELRREMLNTTLYLLPFGNPLGMVTGFPVGGPGEMMGPNARSAFAVAGSRLVFGDVDGVEQAIRDLRRTDLTSIQADPMFRWAAKRLPAQAGAWDYRNNQVQAEAVWELLKQAARDVSKKPAGEGGIREAIQPGENEETMQIGPAIGPTQLTRLLKPYCDFNQLPEFQAVRKYFGAAISYLAATDEGIFFQVVQVTAPRE
jgi:hypothetical protein